MAGNTNYLKALLENDSKGIMTLYQIVFPKVLKFIVLNKGQREDAEDIFQKALIQITVRYRKNRFEITSSFEAYLFTACKNLWRRELSKSKKKVTNSGIIELRSEERDLALATLEQERSELLNQKLKTLSENCKKVLRFFFAKLSHACIAEEMQYSSEIVARQRVFKCKSKLMEEIKKDWRYNSLKEL